MSLRFKNLISALVIAFAVCGLAPAAYAQTSTTCDEEISRIESDLDLLEADSFEAVSIAEADTAKCIGELAGSEAVRAGLDVDLHDYEQAFRKERDERIIAEERLRVVRRSRVVWAVGGASVAAVLGIILAVVL